MFLTEADLRRVVKLDTLRFATDDDADLVAEVLKAAWDTMAMYLSPIYDTDTIETYTEGNRPPMLVKWGVDIANYDLQCRVKQTSVGETVRLRYEDAIDQLKNVHKVKLPLPRRPTAANDQTNSRVAIGKSKLPDSDY